MWVCGLVGGVDVDVWVCEREGVCRWVCGCVR